MNNSVKTGLQKCWGFAVLIYNTTPGFRVAQSEKKEVFVTAQNFQAALKLVLKLFDCALLESSVSVVEQSNGYFRFDVETNTLEVLSAKQLHVVSDMDMKDCPKYIPADDPQPSASTGGSGGGWPERTAHEVLDHWGAAGPDCSIRPVLATGYETEGK